jgi:hypothetical protein
VRQGNLEPVIAGSARKHGIADEDMLHAYNNPIRADDMDDGLTMLIGPGRAANLLEVCVVAGQGSPVIIHAMPARTKYLRRR